MSVSDDQRREVAARLRGLDAEITSRDTLERAVDKFVKAVRGDIPFSPIRYSVRNLCGLANMLADLIDRPTCEDAGDGWTFCCSACGCELDIDDREGEPTIWDGGSPVPAPSFCPNCGAMVVEKEDNDGNQ